MKSTRNQVLPSPAPVERSNLTALILQRLRDYVVDHAFAAGDRLPSERELALRLNVSRPSLRRALDWLDRQGALRRVQGGGTFLETSLLPVFDKHLGGGRPLAADPAELNEAVNLLAVALLRQAAERATAEQCDKIRATLDDERPTTDDDWRRRELGFYRRVAGLAGNSILAGTLESLLTQAMPAWHVALPDQRLQGHHAVLDALARRDAESAIDHLRLCLPDRSEAAD